MSTTSPKKKSQPLLAASPNMPEEAKVPNHEYVEESEIPLKKIHIEGIYKKTYHYTDEECLLAIKSCKFTFYLSSIRS